MLKSFHDTTFNLSPPLPVMTGPPAKIHLKDDAIPYARHSPIPVPHHWKDKVKASLDLYVLRGVIRKVPLGEPVEWCFAMVCVDKKN